MRRALGWMTFALLAVPAATASASGLDLRLGAFYPRAESNLFVDDSLLYNVEKSDWVSFAGGIEFNAELARNVELGVHVDGYDRSIDTSYRNYTTEGDREIRQTLKLQIIPVGVTLRLVPTSSRVRVAPYLAVGGDAFFWQYEEHGDFIDFDDPSLPIIPDAFFSDGVEFGGHAAAGVRFKLTHDFSLVGEGRYQFASKADMGEDFTGNRLDLDGWSWQVGIHVRF
jgi:opacity protein-like surface antigen